MLIQYNLLYMFLICSIRFLIQVYSYHFSKLYGRNNYFKLYKNASYALIVNTRKQFFLPKRSLHKLPAIRQQMLSDPTFGHLLWSYFVKECEGLYLQNDLL